MTATTRTSIGETKAAARRFYDALNQALAGGDLAPLDHVVAEDAVDHNPVPGMKPGLAGIKESFAEGRVAFPDLRFTVEHLLAEGDQVACRVTIRATHRGDSAASRRPASRSPWAGSTSFAS